MFCYQCQETKGNKGCDIVGVCGKKESTANLLDLLMYVAGGVSYFVEHIRHSGVDVSEADNFVRDALFTTITNVNFDDEAIEKMIKKGIDVRVAIKSVAREKIHGNSESPCCCNLIEAANYFGGSSKEMQEKAATLSILNEENEDIRSLKELLIYGLKGVSAYAHHAAMLGYEDAEFYKFMHKVMAYVSGKDLDAGKLQGMVIECGKYSVDIMALLDKANTETFGKQEITTVKRGTIKGKGILVSGHDLLDIYELLKQTEGKGINIYTHGEMLTTHAYPKLKKFSHLVGNFGGAWHAQQKEMVNFAGPILFTTNCIQEPKGYGDRVFTTGVTGYEGVKHIAEREKGKEKDFSQLIEAALNSPDLEEKDEGVYTIGFAKDTVMSVADKVIEAVKSGAITKFVVMAGCDGRNKNREYFREVAEKLPKTTIILTAGCAKYRYNDIDFGNIGGIPRMLDAGQCNDCYSLAYIALQLKEAFGLENINDLPLAFDIGWYEQKAVAVLLALLYLGFKNVRLGPTLPAFLSPNVANVLVSLFGIQGITTVEEDLKKLA